MCARDVSSRWKCVRRPENRDILSTPCPIYVSSGRSCVRNRLLPIKSPPTRVKTTHTSHITESSDFVRTSLNIILKNTNKNMSILCSFYL